MPAAPRTARVVDAGGVFLRLGATSFGGPAAHIAMMEEEVVRRRGWLTREEFLDLLGAANLIPGPNSTEMAIHIGHRVAGWPGLLVAGVCFILPGRPDRPGPGLGLRRLRPAAAGRPACSTASSRWSSPWSCRPCGGSAGPALKSWPLAGVAAARRGRRRRWASTSWSSCSGRGSLRGAGPAGLAGRARPRRRRRRWPPSPGRPSPPARGRGGGTPFGLWPLFLFFLKVGSVLFGSGYVLLAFLRADLVERYGWLTERQLLDAVAVGR